MAITNSHYIKWRRKGGATHTCYAYTSAPSSPYIGYCNSNGTKYYIKLSTSTSYYSSLMIRKGGRTYMPYPPQATVTPYHLNIMNGSVTKRGYDVSSGGFSAGASLFVRAYRSYTPQGTNPTLCATSNSISISAGSTQSHPSSDSVLGWASGSVPSDFSSFVQFETCVSVFGKTFVSSRTGWMVGATANANLDNYPVGVTLT